MVMNRNLGYSAANNVGAAAATGPRVLFLNSDVLPIRPGWVSQLAAGLPGARPLRHSGLRLLFEDGSIQHAGMHLSPFDPGCRLLGERPIRAKACRPPSILVAARWSCRPSPPPV